MEIWKEWKSRWKWRFEMGYEVWGEVNFDRMKWDKIGHYFDFELGTMKSSDE